MQKKWGNVARHAAEINTFLTSKHDSLTINNLVFILWSTAECLQMLIVCGSKSTYSQKYAFVKVDP